jgi:hypothetical protein
MDIGSIYANSVRNKGSISLSIPSGGSFPTSFERDPENMKLQNSIFNTFKQIVDEEEKINPSINITNLNSSNIKEYSFEDAIKELYSMNKNT